MDKTKVMVNAFSKFNIINRNENCHVINIYNQRNNSMLNNNRKARRKNKKMTKNSL